MTFAELKAQCYRDTGYQASPPSDVVTRFAAWINEGHRHLLRLPSMTELRQGTLSFSSVANQPIYGMPQAFERMDALMQVSNNIRLRMLTRDQYRLVDPGERSNGTPYCWVPVGLVPVLLQPAALPIYAVSTSGSDTTQTVNLIGITSDGDMQGQKTAALNGLTRVQVGTFTDYTTVISWTLTAACAGDVDLYDAVTAGNLLARIPAGATSVQYQGIRLWPTPGAALLYTVDGQFEIPTLVNDNDVPLTPPSYHDLFSAYGRMREYERTNDPRYDKAQAEYELGVQKLRSFVEFPPDYHPVAGSALSGFRWTNLGSWYPGDGWGRG